MQGVVVSYGLLAGLAIALLVAAFTDLKRRQIDNGLNAAIALAAPLYWWASGMSLPDVGWQLGLALLTFAVSALLFALRQMGGGDVKLLTALALWIAPPVFATLCIIMALIGSTMSIVAGMRNLEPRLGESLRTRLALAATGLWVLFSLYALYVVGGGQPLPLGEWLAGLTGPRLLPFVLLPGLLVAVICIAAGTRHILRRQRSRLAVPYGLAISLAGLWMLAIGKIPALHGGALAG